MENKEDFEAEIVTPEVALWNKVKESTEIRIKQLEESLIVENAMLELAKSKI